MSDTPQKYEIDGDGGPPENPLDGRFQILALSGGGYRGLFTASILAQLEAEAGCPLRDRFDVITGTSIGSILAGALAVGVPAADCLDGMLRHGELIFPTTGRVGKAAREAKKAFIEAPYKTKPLEAALSDILKEQCAAQLHEIEQGLTIPCVSHTRANVKVLRSKGVAGSDASKVSLADAMLASAAAPTYFPSRKLLTEVVVDGGLVANAPEMIAVTDAVKLRGVRLSDIHVLSVGTASTSLARPPEEAPAASIAGWMAARQLFQVTMQAQESLAQSQCKMLIGGRYLRLDAEPAPEQAEVLGLDKADEKATETLIDLARTCWESTDSTTRTKIADFMRG